MASKTGRSHHGVILPEGRSGSALMHGLLRDAVDADPAPFAAAAFPRGADAFRKRYGAALVRLEAVRADLPNRSAFAQRVAGADRRALCFRGAGGAVQPLEEALRPAEIAATLRAWAGEDPVHLGLYAYAPGSAREWRLEAAMNAIAESLEPGRVRSVSLLVSPTTPMVVQPEDRAEADRRFASRPLWQAALHRAGLLPRGPHPHGDTAVAKAVVSIQGASYQAAQYVAKMLRAEAWATEGLSGRPVRVSANVAPISRTRSLRHPVFEVAFAGAVALGVHTYPPDFTRPVMGLLALHDVLGPPSDAERSPAERARALFSRQVHGGLYSAPIDIDSAIRVAALLGVVRRPQALLGLGRAGA